MSYQTPPKKKRIKRVYRHPNLLFEKWLQEWCDEAKAKDSQMKFNYARAVKSLRLFPLPLYRGADCKVLSGFGDKICQQIDRRLQKHIEENGPIDWEKYHQAVDHSAPKKKRAKKTSTHTKSIDPDDPDDPPDISNNESLTTSGKKRSRQYVPAVRSGPYAILMAFHIASTDDGFPDHLKRTELIEFAQEFCDSSFTQTPDGSHYTAWSSMSTLIKKNLITKEGSPARYALTISGEELCKRLVAVDDGTNMRLDMSQNSLDDPDDPVPVSDKNRKDLSDQELNRKKTSTSQPRNRKKTNESITNHRTQFGNIEIDEIASCSNGSPDKKSQNEWSYYEDPEDLEEFVNYSDSIEEESNSRENQENQDMINDQNCELSPNSTLSTTSTNIPKEANSPNPAVSESILEEFDNCTLLDDFLPESSILASDSNMSSNKPNEHLLQAENLSITLKAENSTFEATSTMVTRNSYNNGNRAHNSISIHTLSSSKERSSSNKSEVSQFGSIDIQKPAYNLQSDMDKLSVKQKNISAFFKPKNSNDSDSAINSESGHKTGEISNKQNVNKENDPLAANEMCTNIISNKMYENKDTMENKYKFKRYGKRNGKSDDSEDVSKPYKRSFKRNKRRKRKDPESSSEEESTPPVPIIIDEPKEPSSAIVPPINCSVPITNWKNLVFFDLETTSLRLDCDIVQIAAIDGSNKDYFNSYVMPTKKMDKMASFITKISFKKGILRHNFRPVYANPAPKALEKFLFWIQQRAPVMLVAHNASFDSKRLFYALNMHRLTAEFKKHVLGFVDTLPLFQNKFPNLPNHKQETVVNHVLNMEYEAHNAIEDVKSLKDVYNTAFKRNFTQNMERTSSDFVSAHEKWMHEWEGKKRASTFSEMLSRKIVSENMVDKMANSGLTQGNLEFVYKSKGVNGIEFLLREGGKHGKPRVTKNKRVINDIVKYFT